MAKGVKRSARAYPFKKSKSPWPLVLTVLLSISIGLLLLLALGIFSLPLSGSPPEEPKPVDRQVLKVSQETRKKAVHGDGLGSRGDQWTEVLSWEPRAFIYHNFLSKEECEYLIELAKPNMEKSLVVDSDTGKNRDSRVRTSSGTFLKRGQDKVIRAIEQRISDYTFIPVEHGEGLQVLHYEVGQKYDPHFDYFLDEYNTHNGGQRMATFLMYLSDVEQGGETIFPSVTGINASSRADYDQLSECGKTGLAVRPNMGDALLFWSMKPDTTLDPLSLHGGCPVIEGNKWSSTKWMRIHEYKAD